MKQKKIKEHYNDNDNEMVLPIYYHSYGISLHSHSGLLLVLQPFGIHS